MTMGIARLLEALGHALLGAGMALVLLRASEPVGSPLAEGLSLAILATGAWITLAARAVRRETMPCVLAGLPLIPIALGAFPRTPDSVRFSLLFATAWSVWLALQGDAKRPGLSRAMPVALLAMGGFLALLGTCEFLFQRDELRQLLGETPLPSGMTWEDSRARAFLLSDRASATFINANSFGGFLLLVLPVAILRSHSKLSQLVVPLVLGMGFLASGSLGAMLCLVLALALWAPARPIKRWSWMALLVGGAFAGMFALLGPGSAFLKSKVSSFGDRLDYWKQALRLVPETPALGHGFHSFAELRFDAILADEEGSIWVHNTPLQLLLELGPLTIGFVIAGIAVWVARRSRASALVATAVGNSESEKPSRAFLLGVVAATFVVPFFSRGTTLLPLRLELPFVDAVVNGTVVAALLMLLMGKRSPAEEPAHADREPEPRLLRLGLAAFALHSVIDFDIYSPGNTVAVFALLGIVGPRVKLTSSLMPSLLIAITMTLPILAISAALEREEVAHVLTQGTQPVADRGDASASLAALAGPTFPGQALASLLNSGGAGLNRAILERFDSLPPALADRPLHRLWAAQAKEATLTKPSELRALLGSLKAHSSSRLWPEYLLLSARILDRLGQSADASAARAEALRLRRS